MGLPSGVFSSPRSGTLVVAASAKCTSSSGIDFGGSTGGGIALRPYIIRGGVYTYLPALVLSAGSGQTIQMTFNYPGGSVPWTVGIEEQAWTSPTGGGVWFLFAQDIELLCELRKR